jgi:hypothetical protein
MSKSVYEILMTLTGGPQVTADLNAAEKNVNLLAQATDAVIPGLIGAGEAMLAFSERAILANANMERGLTNLLNITEGTKEGVDAYNEALTGTLENTGYQIERNALLTASYDAASSGFTETADALGVVSAAARLAIAGNSGLTDATDNMASSQKAVVAGIKSYGEELAQYGDAAAQATVISEKMYKVVKLGITDISELAPEFAELAPLAASAGMSLDELSASYAAMTSAGIKTTITTTNIKALLSSIARGGGTEEAKAMIDELGLSFDTTALATDGLVGILATLEEKGVTGMDQYIQLTGSVEAATALAALSAQDFAGALDYVANGVADLQKNVDNTSADPLGRLTEATNRFDDALAMAGGSLAPIQSQLLDLGTSVLNTFNGLPDSVKSVLGPMVSVGGAALKSGGEILQMASNIAVARIAYFQWRAEVAAATVAQAAQTTATVGATTANAGFTASTLTAMGAQKGLGFTITATTASMGAFIAAAAAATAAIGVLTFALVQHEKNKKTVLENEKIGEAYAETEILAQKLSTLVIKMRETGEALPDAEFNQWISLLEQADGGTGVLEGQMQALINVQNKAKQGTLETTEALQGGTTATRDFAAEAESAAAKLDRKKKADEDAAKAAKKQAEAAKLQEEANSKLLDTLDRGLQTTSVALANFEQDMANRVADGTVTSQEAYQQRANALRTYAATVSILYEKTVQAETLSTQQRADLQAKQTADLRANQQQQIELHRAWAQELRKINDEQNQIELLALETRAYNESWTQEQLTEQTRNLKAQQLKATITTIQAELSAAKQGSQRQRELTLDLYRSRAELARNTGELAKDTTRTIEKEAKKAKDARIAAWNEETRAFTDSLANQEKAAQAIGARIANALNFQSSLGGLQSEGVSTYETTLNAQSAAKSKILQLTSEIAKLEQEQAETGESQSARIAELNTELEKQKNIQTLTAVELQNSAALLAQMGIQIKGNLTDEQAALAIATVKLDLENQAIAIKLQQETISTRLKQLEQDRLILELQRQATAEDISEAERANIQAQITNAQAQKELLAEQLAASAQLAGLQQANNTQAARTGLAAQGINPQDLGATVQAANNELATKIDQSFTNQLGKLSQSLSASDKANQASLENQAQRITAGLGANAQAITGSINPLASGINALGGNLSQGFGTTVQATQIQTQQLQAEIRAMNQNITNLPGNIARLLPRPSSQAR